MSTPSLPVNSDAVTKNAKILYQLFYLHRNPAMLVKQFESNKDFKDVVETCKRYCEQMNYRFIRVQPFISNLEEEMKKTLNLD